MRPSLKTVAGPGRVGMEECSLDLNLLFGAARPFVFLEEGVAGLFPIDETRFS